MRPINTAEDLFRWFEEVGSGVVPPDDVASQAKLVRDALKRLLAGLPERVAEAVMGGREACALLCDAEFARDQRVANERARARLHEQSDHFHHRSKAFHEAAHAIRSRPAHAHPMAGVRDEVVAALTNASVHMEYDYPGDTPEPCGLRCDLCRESIEDDGSGHASTCLLTRLSAIPSPADDSAVQRVVTDLTVRRLERQEQIVRRTLCETFGMSEEALRAAVVKAQAQFKREIDHLTPGAPDHG